VKELWLLAPVIAGGLVTLGIFWERKIIRPETDRHRAAMNHPGRRCIRCTICQPVVLPSPLDPPGLIDPNVSASNCVIRHDYNVWTVES
jgi:hypothetical protein